VRRDSIRSELGFRLELIWLIWVPGIPSSAYSWQTLGNAVSLISALIAALLYGNIGIKVFYAAVLRDVFKFPGLDQKKGKWIWVACGKSTNLRKTAPVFGTTLT